jgi:23S rRNA (adenine2030-N6)-methyltransferase
MLSYQHAYHAGHAADIFKHAVLASLLGHLTRKPAPLSYFETHAGRGLYPLASPEMQKTMPHSSGLLPMLSAPTVPPELSRFTTILSHFYNLQTPSYPGSPAVAQACLREADTLHLAEAHPAELGYLKSWAKAYKNIHVHAGDGHVVIPALLAPSKRALVLIDPSYELKNEYQTVIKTVQTLLARWKDTVVVVWYPVLPAGRQLELIHGLAALNVQATYHSELIWNGPEAMAGSGQIILNTPYGSEAALAALTRAINTSLFRGTAELTSAWINPPR